MWSPEKRGMLEVDHVWAIILVSSDLISPPLLAIPSMCIVSKTISMSMTPKSLFLSETSQLNFRLIEPNPH